MTHETETGSPQKGSLNFGAHSEINRWMLFFCGYNNDLSREEKLILWTIHQKFQWKLKEEGPAVTKETTLNYFTDLLGMEISEAQEAFLSLEEKEYLLVWRWVDPEEDPEDWEFLGYSVDVTKTVGSFDFGWEGQ